MYDEICCDAPLPDGLDAKGTIFQTKSFPDAYGARYTISDGGRVLDARGVDMEVDGYISFYANKDVWREYQAYFRDGNLDRIAVVTDELTKGWHFGVAKCRISQVPSAIFDTPTETEACSQDEVLQRAYSVFGDTTRARAWMETPIQALDGHPPINLCASLEGRRRVIATLKKIEGGDFS
ncbi:MAG: hypothetical protein CMN84_10835 [Spongiibacteraceae bacterium]|jgi:hypothetical protein|nr:hypothetical protein [Spongiibacteraceae bacterium]